MDERVDVRRRRPLFLLVMIGAASVWLASCGIGTPTTTTGTENPIGATAVPAASPTVLASATPRPDATIGVCTNNAEFVTDVTVPDGTQVSPGTVLDKRWRVLNTGTCDWGPGYSLVLISGDAMLFPGGDCRNRSGWTMAPN